MTINQAVIIAATVLFAVAFLIAVEVIGSDDGDAWITGGFTLFAAGHIAIPGRRG